MRLNAAQKDKGLGPVYLYTANWDADMVYGCVCREGYTGGDCSQRKHPLFGPSYHLSAALTPMLGRSMCQGG